MASSLASKAVRSKIVRNGTKDDPAYLVEQEDGAKALKLGSELSGG